MRRRQLDCAAVNRRPGAIARALTLAAVLPVALAGCGQKSEPPTAENNGVYVQAGPITYQLEVSRELNPFSTEDSQYLAGLPRGTASLKPDELWYGVFVWAKNQTKQAQTTTDTFDIVDTQGTRYYPIRLNRALNQYVWSSRTLQRSQTEPSADTTASLGPTQGGLLLFKLNTAVYSNRPLSLEIYAPGDARPSSISLDL